MPGQRQNSRASRERSRSRHQANARPTNEQATRSIEGGVVARGLVGQALFIPSPCEGLPVRLCNGEIVSDRKEMSYHLERRVVMLRFIVRAFAILAAVLPLGRGASCNAAGGSVAIPNPSVDAPLAPSKRPSWLAVVSGASKPCSNTSRA